MRITLDTCIDLPSILDIGNSMSNNITIFREPLCRDRNTEIIKRKYILEWCSICRIFRRNDNIRNETPRSIRNARKNLTKSSCQGLPSPCCTSGKINILIRDPGKRQKKKICPIKIPFCNLYFFTDFLKIGCILQRNKRIVSMLDTILDIKNTRKDNCAKCRKSHQNRSFFLGNIMTRLLIGTPQSKTFWKRPPKQITVFSLSRNNLFHANIERSIRNIIKLWIDINETRTKRKMVSGDILRKVHDFLNSHIQCLHRLKPREFQLRRLREINLVKIKKYLIYRSLLKGISDNFRLRDRKKSGYIERFGFTRKDIERENVFFHGKI